MDTSSRSSPSTIHLIKLTLLSWFSMIGFDFFLHAGLLASLYSQPSPFLLPSDRAFKMIPVGYISFLLFDILSFVLMTNIKSNSLISYVSLTIN